MFSLKNFALFSIVILALVSYSQQGYVESISKDLASSSMAAYCPEAKLEKLACGDNCNNLVGYEFGGQVEYEVGKNHHVSFSIFVNNQAKRFVLAFRGTNSLTQLLYELAYSSAKRCPELSSNTGKVGNYFCHYYATYLREDFIRVMTQSAYDYEGYDFYITGHSLGGAFATLAAYDITGENVIPKEKLHLYNFGSPRVGDLEFVNQVLDKVSNVYRITHNKDLVPHVPPNCYTDAKQQCAGGGLIDKIMQFTLPKFNAYHLKPEIFYPANTTVFQTCQVMEDDKCSNQFQYHVFNVADHRKYLGLSPSC